MVTKRNRRLTDGVIGEVLRAAQEATILPPWLHMLLVLGVWDYIHGNVDAMASEVLTASECVQFRKELVK